MVSFRPPHARQKKQPFAYRCPVCGKVNTVRQGREAALFACFRCSDNELAGAADVSLPELIEDPWTALAPWKVGEGESGPPLRVAEVPSEEKVAGWNAGLLGSRRLMRLLRRERGLTVAAVREFRIGLDRVREGYTLPIYDEGGDLVNVSWRAPKGRKLCLPGSARRSKHRLAGQTAENGGLPLYPMPLPDGPLLLCEGEWDALIARQEGLPAVTGLLGKQWHAAWDPFVVGRSVAVAYDVGAENEARRTAERLRHAGARRAWAVSLELPEEGSDVCDWFSTYGQTADELCDLIRRARRTR